MPSSQKRHVVSVGEPPKKFLNGVETIRFVIHDFKDRKEKICVGHKIESPTAKAHGYEWSVSVYPRSSLTAEFCFFCLTIHQHADEFVKLSWRCKGFESLDLDPTSFNVQRSRGVILQRDDTLENVLEDDSLVIEVDIRIAANNQCVWYPKELQQQPIWVDLYQDASSDTSDVVFSVGESIFRVHKSILSLRGKKLYEIAMESDNDAPIPIHSTRKEIFKSFLDFVYTVKTPVIENEDIATELLVAADRYDCVHLKLYVESVIVDKFLTPGNAAALLILGDSHSCALLKEAAMNLYFTDTKTVKKAQAWSRVKESNKLLVELLDCATCSKELELMDVTKLREDLGEANLELDGSHEVLFNRMKTHRAEYNNT